MIMQTVILAAGQGTRMGPLSEARPKPMLQVGGKPLLAHVSDAAIRAGASELIFVIGYRGDTIRSYFGSEYHDIPITYVDQQNPDGTADAVATAGPEINGTFAVLNGDNVYDPDSLQTLFNSEPSIGTFHVEDPTEYGVISKNGRYATGIVEKPRDPPTSLANCGAYVFPEISMDYLQVRRSERGEYELTDTVSQLIAEFDFEVVEFDHWLDVGRPWELLDANNRFLEQQDHLIEGDVHQDADIAGPVTIETGATVASGVCIDGPVFIGKGSHIGPNAYIRAHTLICENAHIGHAVEVKNSIIMSNSSIAHLSYVGDSIIGQDVNFGAGTTVANLRHDAEPISVSVNGDLVSTGRRKFGVIVGDNVKTGINSSLLPGITLGCGTWTNAGEVVREDRIQQMKPE